MSRDYYFTRILVIFDEKIIQEQSVGTALYLFMTVTNVASFFLNWPLRKF